DAGAVCGRTLHPEGSLGDGTLVEHGVHVTDQQNARSARTMKRTDHQVSQLWIAVGGRVCPALDLPSVLTEPSLAEIGDLVHAVRRVRAAADVHHPLEGGDELVVTTRGEIAQRSRVHVTGNLAFPRQAPEVPPHVRNAM